MGPAQCTAEKKDDYLWLIVERKIKNKDTPLDKKIHNEYLKIKGQMHYQFEIQGLTTPCPFEIQSAISPKKKVSRFKKWYKMAFLTKPDKKDSATKARTSEFLANKKNSFFVNSKDTKQNYPRSSNYESDNDKSYTISNIIGFTKIPYERKKSIDISFLIGNKISSDISSIQPVHATKVIPKPAKSSEQLVHTKIDNYSINQAEVGLRAYLQKDRHLFITRLIKGPPESFRWVSWIIAGELNEERDESVFLKYLNSEIDKKADIQIQKDLGRTLSQENLHLTQAKTALYNVLRAYANCDSEVLYCQGMNFITGFLLIVSDFNQVDSFYMLRRLFQTENFSLRGFFTNDFPLLKLYVYQFEILFQEKLPSLKKHLDDVGVPNELWVAKWIQTLYTIGIPLGLLVRLWDCLLSKGMSFIFNFTLSILVKYQKELLSYDDLTDISDFFKNLQSRIQTEEYEQIIQGAFDVKISVNELNKLRETYESKFKVKLNYCKLNSKDIDCDNIFDISEVSSQDPRKDLSQIIKKPSICSKTSTVSSYSNSLKFVKFEETKSSYNSLYERRKIGLKTLKEKEISFSEDVNLSKCSETDTRESTKVADKIKNHTMDIKKKSVTIEVEDLERLSSLNNVKINTLKPYFDRRIKMEKKNPFK